MKKLTVLLMIILVAGLFAGCWVLPESKLDKITVDPEGVINLKAGDEQQLIVTAWYTDGTEADVTSNCDYSSDNTEVATVNDEGLIIGVRLDPLIIGEATILVTHTQHNFWTGRITRTAEVKVMVH